jgi:hypothetical protein
VPDSPEVRAGFILTQWGQIQIPAASLLLDPKRPTLYDPSGQEDLADYQQFLGDFTADTILGLIRAGRQVGAPGRLWGACYGHLLWWPEGAWPPSLSGQLGLGRVLASSDLDFLVGPAGAGALPTTLLGSVLMHGKLYLAQPGPGVADPSRLLACGAGVLCSGSAQAAAASAPAAPPDLAAALVVETASVAHLSPAEDFQRATLQDQARELEALGGRWQGFLLSDLPAAEACPLQIMTATYEVPDEVLRPLQERLKQPGVVVWVYAPGTLAGGYIDPGGIFDLTGFQATISLKPQVVRVSASAALSGGEAAVLYGPRDPVSPWFGLLEGQHALGQIDGTAWSGLATRNQDGTLSVYSAAPGVPAGVLEQLVKMRTGG